MEIRTQWIPVSEQLPPFGERTSCLVVVAHRNRKNDDVNARFVEAAVYDARDYEWAAEHGEFIRFDCEDTTQYVTHWMPLPEPPK